MALIRLHKEFIFMEEYYNFTEISAYPIDNNDFFV